MFHEVICMYETMLLNVRTNLLQNKRTNDEIKSMLDGLFESNAHAFDELRRLYGKPNYRIGINLFGKMEYEHDEMEKLKKRMYGDEYEIKPFTYNE